MTITGGSALPKDEIDRMVKEAEANAAADKARREEAETRNQAEQLAYSTEKVLKDNADKVPADIASEVSASVEELKTALKGENFEAVKTAMEDLSGKAQKIGEAVYASEQAEANAPRVRARPPAATRTWWTPRSSTTRTSPSDRS